MEALPASTEVREALEYKQLSNDGNQASTHQRKMLDGTNILRYFDGERSCRVALGCLLVCSGVCVLISASRM